MSQPKQAPHLWISLIPIIFLVFLLVVNIIIYKDEATGGANQLALLLTGLVTALLGHFVLKVSYATIEAGAITSIGFATQATIILLVVGPLISLWIMGGIVPTMIYYGLKTLTPTIFLPVSCLLCAIVSLGTGSSWSTTGTVGVALMGVGQTLGLPLGMVGGAIISGAYFGDKMSPLSDTTNLASAMAGTNIFTHIGHMMYTSVPAMVLAIIGFSGLGFFYAPTASSVGQINTVIALIDTHFHVGLYLLLPPIIVLILVLKRIPALPALTVGALLGGLFVLLFQQDLLRNMNGGEITISSVYKTLLTVAYQGFSIETGHPLVDSLFSRGGMSSMLNTLWLMFCAMIFGGIMEATGMLGAIANAILRLVTGAGSLVGATLGTCLFFNLTASDQYLAVVVPGRMFRKAYEKFKLHPKNLSRALEDSGTVTSVLIPWNSGGAYNSGVLGISTLSYLPFCFFNILSPLVSLFLASIGKTIEKLKDE